MLEYGPHDRPFLRAGKVSRCALDVSERCPCTRGLALTGLRHHHQLLVPEPGMRIEPQETQRLQLAPVVAFLERTLKP